MDEPNDVIKYLKENKAAGPDEIPCEVLIHSENKFRQDLLLTLNSIKDSQENPKQWGEMTITTLYKGKGGKSKLINQRGIFLNQIISKGREKMIMNRSQGVINKVNNFQAGSRKGKGTVDQTFILRSCINYAKYLDIPLYTMFYDFKKCFDKLWMQDCIVSLYKLGLNDDMLLLIKNINKEVRITVRKPLGKVEPFYKKCIKKR